MLTRFLMFFVAILVIVPTTASAQGLQNYIPTILTFISNSLIPFLLGIAFLVVVFNIVRYFIVESTSEEGRNKAKSYILYSVFAFVFIVVFWGIVNLLVATTGLDGVPALKTDFETKFGGP